jgi:hypothetical protein
MRLFASSFLLFISFLLIKHIDFLAIDSLADYSGVHSSPHIQNIQKS